MTYYALYVPGKQNKNYVKAVFSSRVQYDKWLRVMYHDSEHIRTLRKEKKKPHYTCVLLAGLKQDENYSVYLLQTKTDHEHHDWYSTVDEVASATEGFLEKNKTADVVVRRVIIDHAYKYGVLEDEDTVIFRHRGRVL